MKIIEVAALIPILVIIIALWSTRSKAFKFDYSRMADSSLSYLREWLSFIFGWDIAKYLLITIAGASSISVISDNMEVLVVLVLLFVFLIACAKFALMRIALQSACNACRGVKDDCISIALPTIFIIEGLAKILNSQFQLMNLCEAVAIFMFGLVLLDYRKHQLGYV